MPLLRDAHEQVSLFEAAMRVPAVETSPDKCGPLLALALEQTRSGEDRARPAVGTRHGLAQACNRLHEALVRWCTINVWQINYYVRCNHLAAV